MSDIARPVRSSREKRKAFYIGLTALFLALYAIALGVDFAMQASLLWLTAPLAAASVVFACLWARNLDEVQLQAHYSAWYWGGTLGLSFSALVLLALFPVLQRPGAMDALLNAHLPQVIPDLSFLAGFLLGMFPAVIGYLIWWGVITLRRN